MTWYVDEFHILVLATWFYFGDASETANDEIMGRFMWPFLTSSRK